MVINLLRIVKFGSNTTLFFFLILCIISLYFLKDTFHDMIHVALSDHVPQHGHV